MKRKRQYKFTDRMHSRQGMISSSLGALAFLMTVGVFAAAYMQNGQAGKLIAVFGFLALILACVGVYYGVRGLGEEDVYRLFPWLGCTVNGVLLVAFATIYVLGW